jgi:hypothetical protein
MNLFGRDFIKIMGNHRLNYNKSKPLTKLNNVHLVHKLIEKTILLLENQLREAKTENKKTLTTDYILNTDNRNNQGC